MNKLEIHNNSITHVHTDAIVNAANAGLHDGSGVCGAIFKAAGSAALAKECDAIGHCDVGSAVITSACGLKAKNGNRYIIHAVGPHYTDGRHGEPEQLAGAYRKSLELAVENGCHSIAFPLISAGKYGYPQKEAWEVALTTSRDFLAAHPEADLDVVFVARDEGILNLGKGILKELEQAEPADPYAANTGIKKAVAAYYLEPDTNAVIGLLVELENRVLQNGEVPMPMVDVNHAMPLPNPEDLKVGATFTLPEGLRLRMDTMTDKDGRLWFPLFTGMDELEKGETANIVLNTPIETVLENGLNSDRVEGVVINPFDKPLTLPKDILRELMDHINNNRPE